jgi:hypothetical protein
MRSIIRELNRWARADGHGIRTGGGDGGFDFIQFHHQPAPGDPEALVTLRAETINGQPVITAQLPSEREATPSPRTNRSDHTAGGSVTVLSGTGQPPREPDAKCDACGVTGTVGRVVYTDGRGGVTATHRFCARCWPEESARHQARWEEDSRLRMEAFLRGQAPTQTGAGPGFAMESATWHGTLGLVRKLQQSMIAPSPPPSGEDLAQMADEIRASAADMEGDMPYEVEAFLRQYGRST